VGEAIAGSIDAIASRTVPFFLRPYLEVAIEKEDKPDQARTASLDHWLKQPITLLGGPARLLLGLANEVQQKTGAHRLCDVWPKLAAVVYQRPGSNFDPGALALAAGSERVRLMEYWHRPEGAWAMEDPRHGGLRLLADAGAFFEFVPVEELGKPRPHRFWLGDLDLGASYGLVVSSCGGTWACPIGVQVCFESRDPPILRMVETAAPVYPAGSRPSAPHPFPIQPPHSRDRSPEGARSEGARSEGARSEGARSASKGVR
jgi:hypothetical protein